MIAAVAGRVAPCAAMARSRDRREAPRAPEAPSTRHAPAVSRIALTEDGHTAVSSGDDGALRVWDVATGSMRRCAATVAPGFVLHTDGETAVVLGDELLAAVRCDTGVCVGAWGGDHGLDGAAQPPVLPHAVSRDGRWVVLAYAALARFDREAGLGGGGDVLSFDAFEAVAMTPDDGAVRRAWPSGAAITCAAVPRRGAVMVGDASEAVRALALDVVGSA